MQAIKEKLNDITAKRRATADAREEEKAQKELAKARVDVAREIRLAREAEASMDLHVNRAAEKAAHHDAKQAELSPQEGHNSNDHAAYDGAPGAHMHDHHATSITHSTTGTTGTGTTGHMMDNTTTHPSHNLH